MRDIESLESGFLKYSNSMKKIQDLEIVFRYNSHYLHETFISYINWYYDNVFSEFK